MNAARPAPAPPAAAGPTAPSRRRWLAGLAGVALAAALPGCSLFVMGGKMLFGDPATDPEFAKVTGVDLTEGEHAVLILATSPESVKTDFPELDQELMRLCGRRMRAENVDVVRSDEVLDWVEDRGGVWDEPMLPDIAAQFDVDYIVTVALTKFSWREHNSPDLLKGRAAGRIKAFEVVRPGDGDALTRALDLDGEGADARPLVSCVMPGDFATEYPTHGPKPSSQMSEKLFRKQFLDRLCLQCAQRFVPHHQRDTVF